MPKFTIVVPTFNHLSDCLIPCIESIKQYTDLSQVEVIVVANGCTDKTKEFIECLGKPFKLLWYEEALGYARASNRGMEAAVGEYIIMLNNDTVLLQQQKNTWLTQLEIPFLADPKMAVSGPMMAWSPDARNYFLIGFCTMFRKSILDKIGLYDESFEAYGEDTDICLRAKKEGYNYTQVPSQEIKRISESAVIGTGDFPIFHKGNETYRNWPGGEALLAKNNKILFERWGQFEPDISRAVKCDGYMSETELMWLGHEAMTRGKR